LVRAEHRGIDEHEPVIGREPHAPLDTLPPDRAHLEPDRPVADADSAATTDSSTACTLAAWSR
jgi:hypothetical protein